MFSYFKQVAFVRGVTLLCPFFTIMDPNILVVKQIPSYVKGTNNFINEINDIGSFLPNSYLVTIYVKLYMPNSEGIQAV